MESKQLPASRRGLRYIGQWASVLRRDGTSRAVTAPHFLN